MRVGDMEVRSAAVIGLGLIGGSVARDLAARGVTVRAYDPDAAQLDAAVADGVVSTRLDVSFMGVRGADVVVIAVPVDAALNVLRQIAPFVGETTLVTDVGSTKASIIALAAELGLAERFVGSHPMAGDHRSGWRASRADLFVHAPVYLCAAPSVSRERLAFAHELWAEMGARATEMGAAEHDDRLAWTSHMPHMISVTLGLALEDAGVARDELGPGGRDMTRIAGSSVEMWTAIGMDNAEHLERALDSAARHLDDIRRAVRERDAESLRATLAQARAWFR